MQPNDVEMSKPSTALAQSRRRVGDERLDPVVGDLGQDAELIAAEPVAAVVGPDRFRELLAEPRQQEIARRVAEAVVVGLEAVQVVEHENPARRLRRGEQRIEIGEESSPVPEAGQCIGEGEGGRRRGDAGVLAEGQHRPRDNRQHRRRRERNADRISMLDVAVDEHRDRDRSADERRRGERAVFEDELPPPTPRQPGGDREKQERCRPESVEEGSRHVAPDRGLVEVCAVGDRRQRQGDGDQRPISAGAPAGEPEHAGEERQQDDVAKRVGEVDRVGEQLAVGLVQDHVEQDRRSDRGDRQRRHQAVKPDAAVEAREPGANEERETDVCRRVEAEVEDIAPGREGRRATVGEIPEQVTDGPARHRDREADPRRPLGGDQDGTGRYRDDGEQFEPVVDPCAGEGVEPRSTRPDQNVQDEEEEPDARRRDPRARERARPAGRERHADWSHTDYVGSGGRSIKLSAGDTAVPAARASGEGRPQTRAPPPAWSTSPASAGPVGARHPRYRLRLGDRHGLGGRDALAHGSRPRSRSARSCRRWRSWSSSHRWAGRGRSPSSIRAPSAALVIAGALDERRLRAPEPTPVREAAS